MTVSVVDSEYMGMYEWLLSLKTIKRALEISEELGLAYHPPNWQMSYDYYSAYGTESDQFGFHVITNLFQYELKEQIEDGEKLNTETVELLQEMGLVEYISKKNEATNRMYVFDSMYNFQLDLYEVDGNEEHPYRPFDYGELFFFKNYMILTIDEYAINPLAVIDTIASKFKEEGYGMANKNPVSA